MPNVLKTMRHYWHRLEDALLVLLLATMIVMSCVQIILRNFFATGLVWNESLLRILVLWLTLIGAMVASRHGHHITINLGRQLVPQRYAAMMASIASLMSGAICVICAYYTGLFVWGEYQYSYPAFANVPSWATSLIIPFSFAVMALRFCAQAVFPPEENSQ